jgi:hypothetical protein
VDDEAMQMLVAPSKGDLQRSVQIGDAALAANEQASPDQRADAPQDDAKRMDRGSERRRWLRHLVIVAHVPRSPLDLPHFCSLSLNEGDTCQGFSMDPAAAAEKLPCAEWRTWRSDHSATPPKRPVLRSYADLLGSGWAELGA